MRTDISPVFLISTGRAGSTALHLLLAAHKDLDWVSNVANRFPTRPALHRLAIQGARMPLLNMVVRRYVRPEEAYGFWDALFPGLRRPCRDLTRADVTPIISRRVHDGLSALSTGRSHILAKLTGWPRIGLFSEIFPTARFVHLVRDGRAVANSLLQVPWWWGWRGPENWRWGPLSDPYQHTWEKSGRSFVVLAGIQWMIHLDAVDSARKEAGGQVLDIRYEDLCCDPLGTLDRIFAHFGLGITREIEVELRRKPLVSANERWKQELSQKQQSALEEALGDHLVRFGYR